jgi:hypothetical protein
MTQNTKTTLIVGGAIVLVSVIAYAIYSSKKSKLDLVDGARVNDEEGTTVPKGTNSTRTNPFTQYVNNPLPTSVGYTFGGFANLK